ncbi:MAG: hypothetical protein M3Y51_07455 [Actinomycetota bacterium]|nr:hypothetical protein [Actinomycetota bacterium]
MTGAASLLVLALVAVAVGLIGAIGVATPSIVDQARADAVADLSALAGVGGGHGAARAVATRSGATEVRVSDAAGGRVTVTVLVGGRSAVAHAAAAGVDRSEEPVGGP